jgi:hypothetical protein
MRDLVQLPTFRGTRQNRDTHHTSEATDRQNVQQNVQDSHFQQ